MTKLLARVVRIVVLMLMQTLAWGGVTGCGAASFHVAGQPPPDGQDAVAIPPLSPGGGGRGGGGSGGGTAGANTTGGQPQIPLQPTPVPTPPPPSPTPPPAPPTAPTV